MIAQLLHLAILAVQNNTVARQRPLTNEIKSTFKWLSPPVSSSHLKAAIASMMFCTMALYVACLIYLFILTTLY